MMLEGTPTTIRVIDSSGTATDSSTTGEYAEMNIDKPGQNPLLNLKLGVNQGVLRLQKDNMDFEIYLNATLSTVFNLAGHEGWTVGMGFDGTYSAGVSFALYDKIVFNGGIQHYSGHLGDELLEDAQVLNDQSLVYNKDWLPISYVRDNDLTMGISVEPVDNIRIYGQAQLPLKSAWIYPLAHIPFWSVNSEPGYSNLQGEIADDQGLTNVLDQLINTGSYRAWIIQTGIESSYHFDNVGSAEFAFNFKFHQDGQTKHQIGEYKSSNPWETEFAISAGFSFDKQDDEGSFKINFAYHDQRFPLLNMFYNRAKYFSVGVTVEP